MLVLFLLYCFSIFCHSLLTVQCLIPLYASHIDDMSELHNVTTVVSGARRTTQSAAGGGRKTLGAVCGWYAGHATIVLRRRRSWRSTPTTGRRTRKPVTTLYFKD